jgi:hypothetical protein
VTGEEPNTDFEIFILAVIWSAVISDPLESITFMPIFEGCHQWVRVLALFSVRWREVLFMSQTTVA